MKLGQAASKKTILEALLREGMVLVALDARHDEVEVPPHLAGDLQLRLNLSHRFGLPLTLDAWGVVATLTFAGKAFDCRLPWSAIFLLVSHASGQPYLFPEDIPNELLAQNQVEGQIPSQPSGPHLSLVAEAKDARGDRPAAEAAAARPTALRPVAERPAAPPPGSPEAAHRGDAPSPAPAPEPKPEPGPRRAAGHGRHLKLVK